MAVSQSTTPHSQDLRKGRHNEFNRIYLLTTATWQRQPLFMEWPVARMVIHAMRDQVKAHRVESLAFVVMPDHLHWLIVLQSKATLAALMRSVKGRSSRQINQLRGTNLPVWQNGYHDHALREDEELVHVARYIVANPLRAGLVKNIGDYPFWDAKWL
jgi:putative transposase